MKKIISYTVLKGKRIQLVKNDEKLRYELYVNRKLVNHDTQIYWLKRAMAVHIIYDLLGILFSNCDEYSEYSKTGQIIKEQNKIE